ncbi:MAG: PAS domain-containing protein [Deltaproteobacteria bacterium]|nr:PAS domain-containing protein [Deltaproteobacteria bacterium]
MPPFRPTLATKVFLAFTALLAAFALLGLFGVKQLGDVGEDLRRITEGHLPLARLAGQLETSQQNLFRDVRRGIEEKDPKSRELILRIAAAYFPEVIRSRLDEVQSVATRRKARERDSTRLSFYEQVLGSVDRLRTAHDELERFVERALAAQGNGEAFLETSRDRLDMLERGLRGELFALEQRIHEETDKAALRADADEKEATLRLALLTAFALLVGVLSTALVSRELARIRPLVEFARAVTRGDYGQKVPSVGSDELAALGRELEAMARGRREREEELDRQRDELERAYHRVAELKRYHESIVQSLRAAVIVTDREGRVTGLNRAAETRLFDLPDSPLGQRLEDLPVGRAIAERSGPLYARLAGGAESLTAVPIPMRDGTEALADATIAPLEAPDGAVLGLVVALEDVTEAVRTKEALIRSERLAAIGRMSAHVTHEIRNPLSSIGLNAELLEGLIQDVIEHRARSPSAPAIADEARALCRAIESETDRLTDITDAYLKFARLPRPQLSGWNPAELLREVATFVRRDLEASKIELTLEAPASGDEVQVDGDQIRQALLNLVKNAKESMPEGGTLTLAALAEGDEVRLEVKDSGVGIDTENLDRIFDPFFSSKPTGTGLGLALTQQIVAEHGGRLEVKSSRGKGSTFSIHLSRALRPGEALTRGAPA